MRRDDKFATFVCRFTRNSRSIIRLEPYGRVQACTGIAFLSRLHFSLPAYFLCSQSGEAAVKARREWEEAMAAVLRDIAATPKQQPRPVVQIVIYESSV